MPVHITSGMAGSAARFAGSAASDTRSKWKAISGAVASVAATVSAAPMRSGSGSARIAPASGAHQHEDACDGREAELPPDVLPSARVDAERHRRGEQQRVPARRRTARRSAATTAASPITPARRIDGPAPVTGT